MKKINIILEGISIEIPPLAKDSEGNLRGGFIGLSGSTISAANNGCTNSSCINNGCTNDGCTDINSGPNGKCDNNGCRNNSCENNGCLFTTAPTETSKTSNAASITFNSLLI